MVQINLPQNSKIKKGKYYKDQTGSKNIRKVNVYRWDPSTGENPSIDTYEVDMDNCPSKILDVLNKIKNEIDPSHARPFFPSIFIAHDPHTPCAHDLL